MKKTLLKIAVAAIIASGFLFVSCGSDDAKKLTPEEQLKTSLTKAVVGDMKTFVAGISENQKSFDLTNFGYDTELSVTIGEAFRPIINSLLGDNYINLNTDWFKSVQVSLKTVLTDKAMRVKVKAGLNNTDIISVDLAEDTQNSVAYLSIPELTKTSFSLKESQLGYSAKEMMNMYLDEVKFLSTVPEESVFTGFANELLDSFISPLNNVSRSKETVQAGLNDSQKVSAEYTVLSVIIDEDAGEKMAKSVSKAIKDSSNFSTIISWMNDFYSDISGERMKTGEIVNGIAEEVYDAIEDFFYYSEVSVDLFVDNKSNLAGARVNIEDEGSVYVVMPQSGKAFGYIFAVAEGDPSEFNFNNIANRALFTLNGYGSYTGGKMTGDFDFTVDGEKIVSFETNALDIAGLKSAKANGSITIHPNAAAKNEIEDYMSYDLGLGDSIASLADNMSFQIDMVQKDRNSAKIALSLVNGKETYLTYGVSCVAEKPTDVSFPKSDVIALDENAYDEYENIINTIDTSAVIANLKKAKVADEYIAPLEGITTDALIDLVEDRLGGGYNYYDDYDYYDYDDYDYYDDYDDYWW